MKMNKKTEHNIDSIMCEMSNELSDTHIKFTTDSCKTSIIFDDGCISGRISYASIHKEKSLFIDEINHLPNVIFLNNKFIDFFNISKISKDIYIYGLRCIFADIEKNFILGFVLDKDSTPNLILKGIPV